MENLFKRKSLLGLLGLYLSLFLSFQVRANGSFAEILDGSKTNTLKAVQEWSFDPYHPNLYRRLGVTPQSTLGEVKEAYRHAAQKVHPNLHHELSTQDPALYKEYEKMFIRVNEAYRHIRAHLRGEGTSPLLSATAENFSHREGYHIPKPALVEVYLRAQKSAEQLSWVIPPRELDQRIEDLFIYDVTSALDVRQFVLSLAKSPFAATSAKVTFYIGTKPQYVEFRQYLMTVEKDSSRPLEVRQAAYRGMMTSFESAPEFRQVIKKHLLEEGPWRDFLITELIEVGINRRGVIDLFMEVLPSLPAKKQTPIYDFLLKHLHHRDVVEFLKKSVVSRSFPSRALRIKFLEASGYTFPGEKREALFEAVRLSLEGKFPMEEAGDRQEAALIALRLIVKHHLVAGQDFIIDLATKAPLGPLRLEALRLLSHYYHYPRVKAYLMTTATNVSDLYNYETLPLKLAAIDALGEHVKDEEVRKVFRGILQARHLVSGAVRAQVENYLKER